MNWLILIIFGIIAIALIVFLIIRNQKDEKKTEKQLDNDYLNSNRGDRDIKIE